MNFLLAEHFGLEGKTRTPSGGNLKAFKKDDKAKRDSFYLFVEDRIMCKKMFHCQGIDNYHFSKHSDGTLHNALSSIISQSSEEWNKTTKQAQLNNFIV